MKAVFTILITFVLCLSSCSDPGIYTALGLYDPAEYSKGIIKTVCLEKGTEFNLLSLTDDYSGSISINYKPERDYNVIKQLSDKESDTLIQTIDYLNRYGDLDSYLSRPLDTLSKNYCEDTKAFAIEILGNIRSFISTLSENLEAAGIKINPERLTDFFDELGNEVIKAKTDTIKDYITIQLTADTIASVFDVLYILIIDTPYDVVEFGISLWDGSGDVNLMENVSANAVELTSVLLDAISQIDLVGKDIGSFFSLSDVVEEIL